MCAYTYMYMYIYIYIYIHTFRDRERCYIRYHVIRIRAPSATCRPPQEFREWARGDLVERLGTDIFQEPAARRNAGTGGEDIDNLAWKGFHVHVDEASFSHQEERSLRHTRPTRGTHGKEEQGKEESR